MNFKTVVTLAASLAMSIGALPASASVIFNFVQAGPARGTEFGTGDPTIVPLRFSGRLIVSDEEYRSGFNLGARNGSGTDSPVGGYSPEVIATFPDFQFTLQEGTKRVVVDNTYLFGPGPVNVVSAYSFTSSPFGLPVGGASITGGGDNFTLSTFANGTFTVRLGSDYRLDFAGCINDYCDLSGRVVASGSLPVSVPEPASMALFGIGLAGLGLVRRKRVA